MKPDTMGPFEWARHEERIAAMPGVVDFGIGPDAVLVSGMQLRQLAAMFRDMIHGFIDGGANIVALDCPNGQCVTLYVRRRGKSLDIGTRKDCAALGWEKICDRLDAAAKGEDQ